MGYSGGTNIARPVIKATLANVPNVAPRRAIYEALITALEDADWDTQDEVMGIDPVFDETFRALHPDLELDSD